jgi:glycine cleavage system H protein
MSIPSDLYYTPKHEWVRDPQGTIARVGVTAYAAGQLGDVVYVDLPEVGQAVVAHEPCGEIESTKSVSELFSPVSGAVLEINEEVVDTPELVNSDPYGRGWLFSVAAQPPAPELLDAAGYAALTEAAE